MTVAELGRSLRKGEFSCLELMERTLAAVAAGDRCNSLITSMAGEAIEEARLRDRELRSGTDRGPFHGIPIAHKDNFYTRGVRTTAGSLVFRDFVPSFDADVVTRLREAGAVCIGKTNMHELAFGITSKNPHYGSVLNPHDPERIAGGSSGGSAALVAQGLLPVATGSDTGGSIRVPASYCGIVGLKPTYGRVSRRGLLPLSFSLDCAGPLATCVGDCALAMEAMAGLRITDDQLDLRTVRVGVPRATYFSELDERVSQAVESAVQSLAAAGAALQDVQTPDLDELNAMSRLVQMSETAALYADRRDRADFGSDVWTLIEQGRTIAAHEYVNAQRLRTLYRRTFDSLWKQVDFLLTPTTPVTAPSLSEEHVQVGSYRMDVRLASTSLVRSLNLTGEPALSMPCGRDGSGLPVGLQIVAKPFAEARLLQFARALESLLEGQTRSLYRTPSPVE